MENEKIGPFIRRLRKERGLTQKELAAALNVTDKAVSKWELGASLPDVALLLPLAETLGVSVTELLGGARASEELLQAPETPPRDTAGDILSYTQRAASQRWEKLRLWIFAGFSGAFLLSALVCLICDAALNGGFSWSLVACCSLALAWIVLLPLLTVRRHAPALSLAALSASILPYLRILGNLLRRPEVFQFGLRIAPAAVIYLWVVWAVCRKRRRRKWRAAGALFLLTAILSFYIDIVICLRTGSKITWGDTLSTLALSAACFLVDFVLRRLETDGRETEQ